VPLVAGAPAAATAPAALVNAPPVRRVFPPGSEWTYVQLYAGSATADRLLTEAVGPLARRLVGSGAADSWFFMRYADPQFHVRVRFHGDPDGIRPAVDELVAGLVDDGLVHDAKLATYRREVERYGGLGLDAPTRAALSRRMRDAFDREFRADATLRKGVAARVRAEVPSLDELLDAQADSDHPFAPGIRVLDERSARISALGGGPLADLAVPLVHMWLNRLHRSENRFHEYVTYALLARLHDARARRPR
jgi:hypothetical protein